jgi:arylsulfatase
MLKAHDAKQPFFLYLAYTAPHWPLHAHESDIAKYRGKYREGWDKLRERRHARMIELGIVDKAWPLTPRDEKVRPWEEVPEKMRDEWDLRMAVYAAQIDRMDQGIGKVLAQLEAMDQSDNTLVLFLADNGGCAEVIDRGQPGKPAGDKDSYLSYGVGWANASNTPFRLYKHWVHEGGISSPLIAAWPSGIKKPGITAQPSHLIDLMATCVDLGQAKYPTQHNGQPITPLAGKSLAPIFRGEPLQRGEHLYWEHEGNRAVRDGQWKLVARHNQPWELYDLAADRTELNNLAQKHPDRVASLSQAWDKWATDVGVDREWGKAMQGGKKKKKQ